MRYFSKAYQLLPDRVQPAVRSIYQKGQRQYFDLYRDLPEPSETSKMWLDVKEEVRINSPTIIDGGAHEGETIEELLYLFSSPEIHAFEANPEKATMLKRKYRDEENIHIYNYALSAKNGHKEFNITKSSSASSLLTPTEDYQSLGEGNKVNRKVLVETKRLDDEIDRNIDIIKFDLQGYEYSALKGSINTLKNTKAVLLETMFNENYQEQKTFYDLDTIMSENKFKLADVYKIKHWPDGQVRHADVLYTK